MRACFPASLDRLWNLQRVALLLILALAPGVCFSQPDDSRNKFSERDKTRDGLLTIEEAFEAEPDARKRGDFLTSDLDQNGTLSKEEYDLFNNITSFQNRPAIPDPILTAFEKTVADVLSQFPKEIENESDIPRDQWESTFNGDWWSPLFGKFDQDQSGSLSVEEIRSGFSVAYGIHDRDQVSLRADNGTRFDWRHHFVVGDANKDGILTKDEFEKLIRNYPPKLKERSLACDTDEGGIYTSAELIKIPYHSRDAVTIFRKLDANFDGVLDQTEIASLPKWQQGFAPWVLKAFDENLNDKLSLVEFLKSPLANPYLDWSQERSDKNHDGALTLDEYHPGRDWQFIGLSAIYFNLLDANNNQRLELREFQFQIDLEQLQPEFFFEFVDADANSQLSRVEFFPDGISDGSVGPVCERHLHLFERADRNGDGTLSKEEMKPAPQLFQIWQHEQQFQTTVLSKFRILDQNQNTQLTFEEVSRNAAPDNLDAIRYLFTLFDMDEDGVHDFNEFLNHEGRSNPAVRGSVYDPITQLIQSTVQGVIPANEVGLPPAQAQTALTKQIPGLERDIASWDRNSDQQLDATELRIGLGNHFGVWHSGGLQARKANGIQFAFRSFRQFDSNHDSKLSKLELKSATRKNTEENDKMFLQLDKNSNGSIELIELDGGPLFWVDTVALFRRYDKDQDAKISEIEIKGTAKTWEQPLANRLIKVFDTNDDQLLSFAEFRSTPFANLASAWVDTEDTDFDGLLSRKEFASAFPDVTPGEANWMFSNFDLDQNDSLNVVEYPIRLNPEKVPAGVVFQLLDLNQDQMLTIAEATGERPQNEQAISRFESKVMRIEDAWRYADEDQNESLSSAEFTKHQANLLAAIHGKKLPRSTLSSAGNSARKPIPMAKSVTVPVRKIDWRFIGLILFNALILLAIVYVIIRPNSNSLELGDEE